MMRRSDGLCGWRAGLAISLAFCSMASAGSPFDLRAPEDGRESGETPFVIECNKSIAPGDHLLTTPDGKPSLVGNVFRDAGRTYLGVVLEGTLPDRKLAFKVSEKTLPGKPGAGVELIPHGSRIEVRVDGRRLTEYIPDDGPKPYYFPVIGPSGAAMTRSYPMAKVPGEKIDHPHHRSLWFTHGSVNKVDFWSEMPGHGTIRETSRTTAIGGAAVGRIRTTDDWVGPDGKKVCEDERIVTVYATKKARVLDFDITIKATAGPVTFGDTKEGMFGLRVATSMDVTGKKGGRIRNAEGIVDKATWGLASPWVDYTGPVDDKLVGVAILNHPSSFRAPTTWHVRDYGLFAANPFGWHDFGRKESGGYLLPAGESMRFRYRLILHDGETESASIPAAFRSYEAPPQIEIE